MRRQFKGGASDNGPLLVPRKSPRGLTVSCSRLLVERRACRRNAMLLLQGIQGLKFGAAFSSAAENGTHLLVASSGRKRGLCNPTGGKAEAVETTWARRNESEGRANKRCAPSSLPALKWPGPTRLFVRATHVPRTTFCIQAVAKRLRLDRTNELENLTKQK